MQAQQQGSMFLPESYSIIAVNIPLKRLYSVL